MRRSVSKKFRKTEKIAFSESRLILKNTIIIVSGLPRSGTSLMMQILHAAGIPVLTDERRKPDENNPRGYFEFEPVKKIKQNTEWLKQAKGKAVKIISYLLPYLPSGLEYQIIFMNRDLDEVIESQNKMLRSLGKPTGKLETLRLTQHFETHLKEIHRWLNRQPNIRYIDVDYRELLRSPMLVLEKTETFLGIPLAIQSAVEVIDPNLYRTKK